MKSFADINNPGGANLRVFCDRKEVLHWICADVGKSFVRLYSTHADGSTFLDPNTKQAVEEFICGDIIILEPGEDLPAAPRHEEPKKSKEDRKIKSLTPPKTKKIKKTK